MVFHTRYFCLREQVEKRREIQGKLYAKRHPNDNVED
jgi:hypothetical protein